METKIYPSIKHILFFDGCSKGNPGKAGIGAVIYEDKGVTELWCIGESIGIKTNNEAEYTALLKGLKQAIKLGIKELVVFGDSLLVINQIKGIYKVKAENLLNIYSEINSIIKHFDYIEFNHVLRDKNKRADSLANLGLKNGN